MTNKESFLVNRLKSIVWAFKGAYLLIKTEGSIQIQFVIAILMTVAGIYFGISSVEWIMQISIVTVLPPTSPALSAVWAETQTCDFPGTCPAGLYILQLLVKHCS